MDLFASLDFSPTWRFREPLLWRMATTLWLSVAACAMAVPAGLGPALGQIRGGVLVGRPITAFVDPMRFMPLPVQAVWIHFALSMLTGVGMATTTSGLMAPTLHVSAHVCDVMRAGIEAAPRGRSEAARAPGLGPRAAFVRVVLPQVWPLVLPPLANVAVSTFKLTAILGILAVDDVMTVTSRVDDMVFRPVELHTAAALAYLAVGLAITALASAVERRHAAARQERRAAPAEPAPAP